MAVVVLIYRENVAKELQFSLV